MKEPEFSQIGTILTIKIDTAEIQSLDDIAHLFFCIGKAIGKPLKNIDITKKGEW